MRYDFECEKTDWRIFKEGIKSLFSKKPGRSLRKVLWGRFVFRIRMAILRIRIKGTAPDPAMPESPVNYKVMVDNWMDNGSRQTRIERRIQFLEWIQRKLIDRQKWDIERDNISFSGSMYLCKIVEEYFVNYDSFYHPSEPRMVINLIFPEYKENTYFDFIPEMEEMFPAEGSNFRNAYWIRHYLIMKKMSELQDKLKDLEGVRYNYYLGGRRTHYWKDDPYGVENIYREEVFNDVHE